MNNMILLFTTLLLFTGCNEEEAKQSEQDNSIYGTWQLTQKFIVNGVRGSWVDVEEGYIITLNQDNTFSSNRYSDCTTARFNMVNDSLTMYFNCDKSSHRTEYPYKWILENKELILSPIYLSCPEGCGERFKKTRP